MSSPSKDLIMLSPYWERRGRSFIEPVWQRIGQQGGVWKPRKRPLTFPVKLSVKGWTNATSQLHLVRNERANVRFKVLTARNGETCLLERHAVNSGRIWPFWRIMLSPSSGSKEEATGPSKKTGRFPTDTTSQYSSSFRPSYLIFS